MRIIFLLVLFGCCSIHAAGQLPFEIFAGHQKTTLDLMFFKYFKNKQDQNSRFLFFNRNRATLDYRQTTTSNLPQFGFTEAISYNHPKLLGLAPVMVVQALNGGVFPKAGIQFFCRRNDLTLFSWVVSELAANPGIDFFILSRFEPKLSEKVRWFVQLEMLNSMPTDEAINYNFIQRIRIGLRRKSFQLGAGVDLNQFGRTGWQGTQNIGGFFRYEF
jgi:hypothetical protein